MAREKSDCRQLGGSTFEHYSSLLQKMNKLQEDNDAHTQAAEALDQFTTQMALCAGTEASAATQLTQVVEATAAIRKKADEVVNQLQ